MKGSIAIRYADSMRYLHGLFRFGMKPGLDRVRELLRRLGNPQECGTRFIHIGGTNGKGSTAACIAAGLQAAGRRTGLYISPFLERWNERIQLDGRSVSDDEVVTLLDEVHPQVDAMVRDGAEQPTEFEVTTAMAFLYFAHQQADWVVLEVGLGGRYDATNVLPRPDLTCLTNVSLDHTEVLGRTAERIAAEKAGILKPGVPCLSTIQHPGVLRVVRRTAAEVGAPLVSVLGPGDAGAPGPGGDPRPGGPAGEPGRRLPWPERQVFDLVGPWRNHPADLPPHLAALGPRPYPELTLGLLGRHQQANAALAVAALELAGVEEAAIRRGLAAVRWPGRFEVIRPGPGAGPGTSVVVLDGAHNPVGAQALAATWRELMGGRRTVLVVGVLGDKDVNGILAPLLPLADAVVVTAPPSPRALPAVQLGAQVRAVFQQAPGTAVSSVAVVAAWEEALNRALGLAGPEDAVLVAGSLYLAGPARTWLTAHFA